MSAHIAYAIAFASAGCLPDDTSGPHVVHTRRELAALIRDTLEVYGLPASRFADVGIKRLWGRIQAAGSASSMHFSIDANRHAHDLYRIEFQGLTHGEVEEMEAAADW